MQRWQLLKKAKKKKKKERKRKNIAPISFSKVEKSMNMSPTSWMEVERVCKDNTCWEKKEIKRKKGKKGKNTQKKNMAPTGFSKAEK